MVRIEKDRWNEFLNSVSTKYQLDADILKKLKTEFIEFIRAEEKRSKEMKTDYSGSANILSEFGNTYETITGLRYFPTYGVDNKSACRIDQKLKARNLDLNGFFAWACANHSALIYKYKFPYLESLINTYAFYVQKNTM